MMSQYAGRHAVSNQYASITITDPGTTAGARQMNPWVRIERDRRERALGLRPNWRMDNGHLLIVRRETARPRPRSRSSARVRPA